MAYASGVPCAEHSTPEQRARLEETRARVLRPIRAAFGPPLITSWIRWRDGCELRTGAHRYGGTVDFTVPGFDLRRVFRWGVENLLPEGYIGRWIYEPPRSAAEGTPQGEHIHMASRADMLDHNGDGRVLALVETTEGNYVPAAWGGYTGQPGDPIPVEGITATASAAGWGRWLILGALVGTFIPHNGGK